MTQYYTNHTSVVVAVEYVNGRRFRAIARCLPEDTFDYERGKQIADLKLRLKIKEATLRELNEQLDLVERELKFWTKHHDTELEKVRTISNECLALAFELEEFKK